MFVCACVIDLFLYDARAIVCVKVTLGITVLLSYSVFMLLVADNMPPTSEFFPLIGQSGS